MSRRNTPEAAGQGYLLDHEVRHPVTDPNISQPESYKLGPFYSERPDTEAAASETVPSQEPSTMTSRELLAEAIRSLGQARRREGLQKGVEQGSPEVIERLGQYAAAKSLKPRKAYSRLAPNAADYRAYAANHYADWAASLNQTPTELESLPSLQQFETEFFEQPDSRQVRKALYALAKADKQARTRAASV